MRTCMRVNTCAAFFAIVEKRYLTNLFLFACVFDDVVDSRLPEPGHHPPRAFFSHFDSALQSLAESYEEYISSDQTLHTFVPDSLLFLMEVCSISSFAR